MVEGELHTAESRLDGVSLHLEAAVDVISNFHFCGITHQLACEAAISNNLLIGLQRYCPQTVAVCCVPIQLALNEFFHLGAAIGGREKSHRDRVAEDGRYSFDVCFIKTEVPQPKARCFQDEVRHR